LGSLTHRVVTGIPKCRVLVCGARWRWQIERGHITGSTDYLRWNAGSSSAERSSQNKPAYGMPYAVGFHRAGTPRASMSLWPALDFTRDKTLTLVVDLSQ